MGYNSKIKDSKEKILNAAIATKILDLMNKLRMEQNESSNRRWIWELLQNAKDVCFDDDKIDIEIEFDGNSFIEFKHNGKPFNIDNITFLIEQVSTKERKAEEGEKLKTTGKFGTGFLMTHLLSEVVQLTTIIKEPNDPYIKIEIALDRSGRTLENIINSIHKSNSVLENLDSYPAYEEYDSRYYNTIFKYNLDKEGAQIAKIGLLDLQIALPYNLIFIPEINQVRLSVDDITYKIADSKSLTPHIKIHKIKKATKDLIEYIEIVTTTENDVTIAIEIEQVNDKVHFKELNSLLPRLFCDFPLLGTEDFLFPVVINSPLFNPTEPRDGIYLTNISQPEIIENKAILKKSLELYELLIDYASENNWQNIFNLINLRPISDRKLIDAAWLENEIIKPIKSKIISTPMIDTSNGKRTSIRNDKNTPNVWFPSSSKSEVIDQIWDLANLWIPSLLPLKSEIHSWYKVLWKNDFAELDLKIISNSIQGFKNIETLTNTILSDKINAFDWLNSYYDLLNFEGKFIAEIINNKYAVIPNQRGEFKIKNTLYLDQNIEDPLKEILLVLGKDIYIELRHKLCKTSSNYTADLEGQITYYPRTQEYVIEEINKLISQPKVPNQSKAISYLISIFSKDDDFPKSREILYDFCKDLLKDEMPEKKYINKWSLNIWEKCDKIRINHLLAIVAENKNLKSLSAHIGLSEKETLDWLNRFIEFLINEGYEQSLNSNMPIFPNQNGNFKIKDDLFLDDGTISESLKDISKSLGDDIRGILLHSDIYLKLSKSREKTQDDIAQNINKLIKPLFAEIPRSQQTKQIFRLVHDWFLVNKEIAKNIFEELYKNKHKLYDDETLAEYQKKAELYDKISESGHTVEELLKIANKINEIKKTESELKSPESLIKDALVSLGISSFEELNNALKNGNISHDFSHISTASLEMLEYVHSVIDRAKMNVKNQLEQMPEYNISNWKEIDTTIVGGVTKNSKLVDIVIRPSDGGHVIFYYDSEKDILEKSTTELWIDNDIEEPELLTLGKILKKNEITKVKV